MKYLKDFESFWCQFKVIGLDILSINKKKSISILIFKSLAAVLPLMQIYLIKMLIDLLTASKSLTPPFFILLISFGFIQMVLAFTTQYGSQAEMRFQQEVSDHFSNRIIDKTSKLAFPILENPGFQDNLYLAQQQARFRVHQLLPSIYNTFSAALSIITLTILFIGLKSYVFLLILVLGLPLTIHKWFQGKKTTDLEFQLAPKERESSYLFQLLTALPWSKERITYNYSSDFQDQFLKIRKGIASEKNKIQRSGLEYGILIDATEVVFTLVIIYYLSSGLIDAKISFGLFILYLQGIQRLQSSSKIFFQSLLQLFQLRVFVKDLYAFFDLPEKKQMLKKRGNTPIHEIRLENISFQYPSSQMQVLEDISIEAKKGEVIAIVGENGSGKSTLVKLISGLYTPQNGRILLNKKADASPSLLQEENTLSVLFQDFQHYHYSAETNIHFSIQTEPETSANTKNAAKNADAHNFIMALAKGYQTPLGNLHKGSVELSGGQWQKLALARIFYSNKDIIILDEPSSALDAFAELELYQKIKEEFKDKIVILISHRLYNLKIADRIYVMRNGVIIEEGGFRDLINKGGVFQSMYEKQKI